MLKRLFHKISKHLEVGLKKQTNLAVPHFFLTNLLVFGNQTKHSLCLIYCVMGFTRFVQSCNNKVTAVRRNSTHLIIISSINEKLVPRVFINERAD